MEHFPPAPPVAGRLSLDSDPQRTAVCWSSMRDGAPSSGMSRFQDARAVTISGLQGAPVERDGFNVGRVLVFCARGHCAPVAGISWRT
jgi:hypothetical protein